MRKQLAGLLSLVISIPFIAAGAFNSDLYYGLRGESVIELQEFLTDQGVYSGPITGNFYSLTLAGVKRFQEVNNVSPVSGYFGPLTRAKANSLLPEITDEMGSTTIPLVAPAKTTEDIIAKLLEQVNLLNSQLQELKKQNDALQTQQVSLGAIRESIEQINQNIIPPAAPPAVSSAPSTPTKIKVYAKGDGPINEPLTHEVYRNGELVTGVLGTDALGGKCETIQLTVVIEDEFGQKLKNQKITLETPEGSITKTQGANINDTVDNGNGLRFFYTPASTSTTQIITFKTGTLTSTTSVMLLNGYSHKSYDIREGLGESERGNYYHVSSGQRVDPLTYGCIIGSNFSVLR
jgi:peptidoglycan hydrolase-like protein with peptidoglycan-binding domain